MQYPQILVYETDGLLAAMLRETAKVKRWALREPRKPESCLRLLRSLCPSVLVLKIATYAPRAERSVVLSRPQQGIAPLATTGSRESMQPSPNLPKEEEQQASVGRISNPSYREKQQVDSLELLADVHERRALGLVGRRWRSELLHDGQMRLAVVPGERRLLVLEPGEDDLLAARSPGRFDAEVTVAKDDQVVNGRSIMGVMMLAAEQGSHIDVTTQGPQAAEALQALRELVEAGFHEGT